jgi:hypothetical protein
MFSLTLPTFKNKITVYLLQILFKINKRKIQLLTRRTKVYFLIPILQCNQIVFFQIIIIVYLVKVKNNKMENKI